MRIVDPIAARSTLLFVLVVLAPAVKGGLTITATSDLSSIAAGGSTHVKVYAVADGVENLGEFLVTFDIAPSAGNVRPPATSLEFVSPDPNDDSTPAATSNLFSDANANFPGYGSFKFNNGQAFGVATDPGSTGFATRFAVSDIYDGSNDDGFVTLTPGLSVLIADLVVAFDAASTTNAAGDLFDIRFKLVRSKFGDGLGGDVSVNSPSDGAAFARVRVASTELPADRPRAEHLGRCDLRRVVGLRERSPLPV